MRKGWNVILFVVGLGVFVFLVSQVGLRVILGNLAATGWWFVPIIGVWGVVYWLNALVWWTLLRDAGTDPGFGFILRLTIAGFALNYITPFLNLGGEPYRAFILRERIGAAPAVSSVILYNFVRWTAHCVFWLLSIVLVLALHPFPPRILTALVGVFLALIIVLGIWTWLIRQTRGILESVSGWLARVPFLGRLRGRLERRRSGLAGIDHAMRLLFTERRRTLAVAIAFEIASRVIASVEFYCILGALGQAPSLVDALYINAASSLILNLLFFVPFELGTREGGLYFVMQSLGYAPGLGVFIGLVNRIRELFWILLGLLLMTTLGRRPAGLGSGKVALLDLPGGDAPP